MDLADLLQLGCDGPLTRPWMHAMALRARCVDHGLPFQDALDAGIDLPTAKQAKKKNKSTALKKRTKQI